MPRFQLIPHDNQVEDLARYAIDEWHTPHPVWPLDRTGDLKKDAQGKPWPVKRKRDKEGYVPEGAIPLCDLYK